MRPKLIKKALMVLIRAKKPTFIWGRPGVGKSQVVAQIAILLGCILLDVRAVLLDPVDLRGIPYIEGETLKILMELIKLMAKDDKYKHVNVDKILKEIQDRINNNGCAHWLPPSFLPKKGTKCILFLDELNAAPPLVQAACYQLVLDRKLGEYTLPEECTIIAAGNYETDRAVTHRMSSALANRFVHLDFEPNVEDFIYWGKHIKKIPIEPELCDFFQWQPALLNNFDPQKNDKAFGTSRSWGDGIDDILKELKKNPEPEVEFDLYKGTVGEGNASQFIGFLKIYKDLFDVMLCLTAPNSAPIPTDLGTLYAVCGALARKEINKYVDNFFKYVNRLPEDFNVLAVRNATSENKKLMETVAFIEWATKHPNIFIAEE